MVRRQPDHAHRGRSETHRAAERIGIVHQVGVRDDHAARDRRGAGRVLLQRDGVIVDPRRRPCSRRGCEIVGRDHAHAFPVRQLLVEVGERPDEGSGGEGGCRRRVLDDRREARSAAIQAAGIERLDRDRRGAGIQRPDESDDEIRARRIDHRPREPADPGRRT